MDKFSNLKGKCVAIIGGAGFIGHNLALKLKSLGAEPHIVDGLQVNNLGYYTSGYTTDPNAERYISFISERLSLLRQNEIGLHIIDVRDYQLISRTLTSIKPDVIVHLAAISHANRSNKDPFSTFDHSMRTLENVLDVSRGDGTHVIYFSSSMVYGNFEGDAVTEDRKCNPIGIYGALKYGAEKLVIAYNQVFDLPYTIIRPSALYGERCVSRRVGQAFIDLTQGVILAILKKEALNETFNITYGGARQINQMAEIVLSEFPGLKLTRNPRDGLMPERGTLNIDKAKQLLGYAPEYPLEKGFIKYIKWYKEFAEHNPKLFSA